MLNHVVAEPVREYLARQRGDSDARGFALEDVAEVFEVAVAAADDAVLKLEGGDIGAALDLVGCVHVAGCAMGLGVLDLEGEVSLAVQKQDGDRGGRWERKGAGRVAYFYFEEVLGGAVNLLEGLLAGVWEGLHCSGFGGAVEKAGRWGSRFVWRPLGVSGELWPRSLSYRRSFKGLDVSEKAYWYDRVRSAVVM
jgi:hypothetical protein